MRHDDDRRQAHDTPSGGSPRPIIDPGFTTSIPIVRPDTTGSPRRPDTTGPIDRTAPARRPDTTGPIDRTGPARRPDATGPVRRTDATGPTARPRSAQQRPARHRPTRDRADNVFRRRIAALALAVVVGAPIAAAIRPDEKNAEAQPPVNTTLAVGTVATTATNAPFLLNPGGAQPTTGTVSLDGLPVLTKPGSDTSAAPAPVAAEAACSGSYTVVSGDSWSYIADKVNVSTSELLAVNDANSSSLLLVGEQLCLPAGASAPTTNAPVTTKAPTTTKPPSTTSPPPTTYYSPVQVEQIIRDIWPDNLEDTAIAIARRESKLNPYAKNWCCHGLFQIYWDVHKVWLAAKGVTSVNQLYDPRINTKAALWVYQRSGSFAPWGM